VSGAGSIRKAAARHREAERVFYLHCVFTLSAIPVLYHTSGPSSVRILSRCRIEEADKVSVFWLRVTYATELCSSLEH
jgi:hypothetical protein